MKKILTVDEIHNRYIHRRYLTGTKYTAQSLADEFVKKGYATRLESGALEFKFLPELEFLNDMIRNNAMLLPLGTVSNGGFLGWVCRVGATHRKNLATGLLLIFLVSLFWFCKDRVKTRLPAMYQNAVRAIENFRGGKPR